MVTSTIPLLRLNNGIDIPQLGLGVWQASDAEAEFAVSEAIKTGYRLIDTAAVYGNEAGVGRAVARANVPRDELFITTKLWNSDQGYHSAMAAFEKSLKRLGLDYIDLYLIHWPVPSRGLFVETWRVFESLYNSGKVRAIGVSNFMPEHIHTLMESTEVIPAVNQVEVHPDFQQQALRRFCAKYDIAVESWSPIGGSNGTLLDEQIVKDIAEAYNKTPAQIVLRWHIQSGLITIPKSVRPDRIRENADVFDFVLDEVDMLELALLDGDNRQGASPYEMNGA